MASILYAFTCNAGNWPLKNSTDALVASLTKLVKQSFSSGRFSLWLRDRYLKLLFKKLFLPEFLKFNLRPISDIAFSSKLQEALACE